MSWSEYSNHNYSFDSLDSKPSEFELRALSEVGPDSRVLEIGFGPGKFLLGCLSQRAKKVIGIDPRASCHSAAHDIPLVANGLLTGQLELHESSWPTAVSLGHDGFDLVFSQSSIHYFAAEERVEALQAVRNILEPGGRLFLTVRSDENSWIENGKATRQSGSDMWSCVDGIDRHFFSVQSLETALNDAGFDPNSLTINSRYAVGYAYANDWDVWLDLECQV